LSSSACPFDPYHTGLRSGTKYNVLIHARGYLDLEQTYTTPQDSTTIERIFVLTPTAQELAAVEVTAEGRGHTAEMRSYTFSPKERKVALQAFDLLKGLPTLRIDTVATGTPAGICTIDNKESIPSSVSNARGIPITGSGVAAATIPGKCAAPPAHAIMHFSPLPWAALAYANIFSGVRCADTTPTSNGIPNSAKTSTVGSTVTQSESDPIIKPTSAVM